MSGIDFDAVAPDGVPKGQHGPSYEYGPVLISDYVKNGVPVGAVKGWLTDTAPTDWLLMYGQAISRTTFLELFTLVGTITGIEYAIVAQSMPRSLTGRAATCLNLLIFVGAFLVQAGFGQVVAWWQPDPQQHYPAQAYCAAFAILVALQLPGLIYFLLHRRPVECPDCVVTTKEDYETGSLRPPR